MPERASENLLLFKVLEDLKDFLPYLVLVGGWVPYLYARYLWKGIRHEPLTTVDIDFGFGPTPFTGDETIAACLRKRDYGEHHLSMDRLFPYVPVARLQDGMSADVEFITSSGTSQRVREKLVGREIKVNEIDNFEILLESPLRLCVENRSVFIPKPSTYVFHKLLTFIQRDTPDKQQKDLYYAYYVLFFSPEKKELTQQVAKMLITSKQGPLAKKNIEEYFEDEFARGPSLLVAATGGSAIRTLVPDVRQDAYARFLELISGD